VVASACTLGFAGPAAEADVLPVTPYLSFSDSPFSAVSFETFFVEDFEDGLLNTPGLSIVSNLPGDTLFASAPGVFTDSVDADDGVIDGLGRNGRSFGSSQNLANEAVGFTLNFAADSLGRFPSHVGLVWTDGTGGISKIAEFFDSHGTLLGSQSAVCGNGSFAGETDEDRFFGAVFASGIARMVIRSPGASNSLEIDHVQYGIVPTPGAAGVLALAGMVAARRRR
jgi:hypothetical protein